MESYAPVARVEFGPLTGANRRHVARLLRLYGLARLPSAIWLSRSQQYVRPWTFKGTVLDEEVIQSP